MLTLHSGASACARGRAWAVAREREGRTTQTSTHTRTNRIQISDVVGWPHPTHRPRQGHSRFNIRSEPFQGSNAAMPPHAARYVTWSSRDRAKRMRWTCLEEATIRRMSDRLRRHRCRPHRRFVDASSRAAPSRHCAAFMVEESSRSRRPHRESVNGFWRRFRLCDRNRTRNDRIFAAAARPDRTNRPHFPKFVNRVPRYCCPRTNI